MTIHPQPLPTHHKRQSRTCHRHLTAEPVTGLCASCLRERLDSIQNRSATTTTAIEPHLRRSKSSVGLNPSSASASEPSRRSCEVRSHNTLHDLFSVNDRVDNPNPDTTHLPCSSNVQSIQAFQDQEEEGEFKTMKEFLDLELGNGRTSRKSFWESASVLSKKLSKWRRKQSKKNQGNEGSNPIRFRETHSEVGEYGLGRRSCDPDPRLSVDVARLSVDAYRLSLDQPRASCDGYLIGEQNPKAIHGDDANAEEMLGVVKEEDTINPGGSVQTRHYYGDSASWQTRRSFGRSGSTRRTSLVEFDEAKPRVSNARASPEPEPAGLFHGAKLLVTEKELRDSNWYSLKDFRLKTAVQSASKNVDVEEGSVHQKKSWEWKKALRVWSLRQTQKESKTNVEAENGDRSLQKLRMVAPGNVCDRLLRSYSASKMNGSSHSEKVVLQNGSVSYSPSTPTNGLVNFRLRPSKSTSGKPG